MGGGKWLLGMPSLDLLHLYCLFSFQMCTTCGFIWDSYLTPVLNTLSRLIMSYDLMGLPIDIV